MKKSDYEKDCLNKLVIMSKLFNRVLAEEVMKPGFIYSKANVHLIEYVEGNSLYCECRAYGKSRLRIMLEDGINFNF